MAAAVLLRIRDELGAIDRVDGANLVFGVHDWGRSPSQRGIRPHARLPTSSIPSGIVFFCDCYLPGLTDDERRDPSISPAFADLSGLPPALVQRRDRRPPARRHAHAWRRATRPRATTTELFVAPDMPHGFMAFPCGITVAWAARTDAWFGGILGARERTGVDAGA